MSNIRSQDGTSIAFDRSGQGPPLILVGGATATRAANIPMATILATHFSVFSYDRRGRGDSGDTPPYAVEHEIEDLDAMIDAAGGSAFVFGHSSGAVLTLEAARKLPTKITKLAVYEPPFIVENSRPPLPEDYVAQLNQAIVAGRRGDAVEIFMTKAVGMPAEFVAQMRDHPHWASSEAVAHTIAYDGAIMGDTMSGSRLPLQKWASLTVQTLVLNGGASEAYMEHGAQALADILPHAQRRTLAGQDHGPAPDVLAPVLVEFFLR